MLHYLSEDPWPFAYVVGLLILGLLVALWVTQQGRFLVWAGIALGVGLAAFGLERAWVTDAERIEEVVHDMAWAVQAADADRVAGHLAPEVELAVGDGSLGPLMTLAMVRGWVETARFDYVHVSRLRTNAGRLTRTGTAEFRVQAMGSVPTASVQHNYMTPPEGTEWSFGLRETEPGTWKVTRITPLNLPRGVNLLNLPGADARGGGRPSSS